MALNFGAMVGGALVIEIVFSLNGMVTLIYDAVKSRDYLVMQGAFVVLTLVMLAANLLADLLYGMADPRIADGRRSGATP
jgi:peptide/nickel transport system permease protein